MYSINDFTKKAISSLKYAIKSAGELGHTFVGSEHMVLGFLTEGSNVACAILKNNNITEKKVIQRLKLSIGDGISSVLCEDNLTPALRKILSDSVIESHSAGASLTGTEYILTTILKNSSCGGTSILKSIGANINRLRNECESINSIEAASSASSYVKIDEHLYPSLCKYSKNLTEIAFEKGFDPVIGREKEIERVIQILTRKTKNNPCLLGEAGVGKTAIVEGLAQLIVKGDVPFALKNKFICSLDIPSMLAGAKYRGDFEERIKNCINEVIGNKDIILFIDEIHTIVGAGAAEGAIDAANILKPELARGELQIIGATTYDEYRRHIEKDSALERRFQPVTINEPDKEQLFRILNGIKPSYENFHMVNIPDSIIHQAVTLSERYIHDRFLPDKAIDIIDEACSHAIIRNSKKVNEEKSFETDITDMLRKDVSELNAKSDGNERYHKIEVTAEDVSNVISAWTGIPTSSINKKESGKLLNLENELKKTIIGQDSAVKALSEAIRRNRVGLKDEKRPIGAFLFSRPTGVGKTELAKSIARAIFDSEDNMIRLDMSEYMESHSISKIIGSPPGYVGFKESGQLAESIRRKPYSVILFDEIEKAHPDILNLLLQITDDGSFRDSQGRKVDLKNSLIILTSNIGTNNKNSGVSLGFQNTENNDLLKKEMLSELRHFFKPELLNRMDDIILFDSLSPEILKKISILFLDELVNRAKKINILLRYTTAVAEYVSNNQETQKYGARPLKRIISNKIENLITKKILENSIMPGSEILVDIHDNNITVEQISKITDRQPSYNSASDTSAH